VKPDGALEWAVRPTVTGENTKIAQVQRQPCKREARLRLLLMIRAENGLPRKGEVPRARGALLA
jgi:hypothetical protein